MRTKSHTTVGIRATRRGFSKGCAALFVLVACRMHGDGDRPPPPVPHGAGQLDLGLPIGSAHWSGGHVIFRVQPRDYDHSARGEIYIIVDPATGSMLELDHVKQLELAEHYAVVDRGGVIAVYDLNTGATVGEPSHITGTFTVEPDGPIAWAEPVGDALRIHLRTLSGTELVLPGTLSGKDIKIQRVNERVIASTSEAVRVWEGDQLVVSRDEPIEYAPTVSDHDIAYGAAVDGDRQVLRVIDLDTHAPVDLHADRTCGAGAMGQYTSLAYCGERTFLVQTGRSFCVWNAATGHVQARFSPARDEFHCGMNVAWVGDTPPGGPYDFYSTVTGKPTRPPHELPDEPGGDHEVDPPDERPSPEVVAKIHDAGTLAMVGELLAGTLHDRAAIWNTDGVMRWQGPAPSEAAAVAFAPDGSLAVVGRAGEVWHVDLATHALRTSQLDRCTLDETDPVVVGPDGKVAAACQRHEGRALVVEGAGTVFQGGDYGWYIAAAATPAVARIGWLSYDGIHEWSLPDRQSKLTFDPQHYGLTFTPDAVRFATASPVAGQQSYEHRFTVTVRGGGENTPLRSISVDSEPGLLALSPDGALLAISLVDKRVIVVDALTGTTLDTLAAETGTDWTRAPLVAWDPVHPGHLAYVRADPARVAIRDVRAGKDVETRAMLRPASGRIRNLVWSLDGTRLALVADQLVTVWTPTAQPETLAFTGGGGVVWRADGSAVLLGDPAAARSLLVCRRGAQTFASLDGCEGRVELAKPLPLQTSTRP